LNDELRKRAFALYKPPFRFDEGGGFIWDANNNHVADVRGWSHIAKHASPEKLQDAVKELIVEALNKLWEDEAKHAGWPGGTDYPVGTKRCQARRRGPGGMQCQREDGHKGSHFAVTFNGAKMSW
jgi:hypothetical protein